MAPNLLEQNFEADAPDRKWVSDVNCVWTDECWLCLAVVLELYLRKGHWLGNNRAHDRPLGLRCFDNDLVEMETIQGRYCLFESGQPVLFWSFTKTCWPNVNWFAA